MRVPMEQFFFFVFYLIQTSCEKIGDENDIMINCRDKIRLIGLDEDDQFDFVTAKLNSNLALWCHYCKEGERFSPKVWYTQNRFAEESVREVTLGMDSKLSDNRVYMKPDHTLIINNITEDDAGMYYCHGPKNEELEFKYNYLVDVVAENIPFKYGNLEEWKAYTQTVAKIFNDKFENSTDDEYLEIRNLNVRLHVVFESTKWGSCNGCYKIRKRFSECKMKTDLFNKTAPMPELTDKELVNVTNMANKSESTIRSEQSLLNAFELSCHSLLFAKYYPKISIELMPVENYAFTEPCYAPCQMSGKSTAAKYRNKVILFEGDHLTLICPEANLESEVIWTKDSLNLPVNTREGNILVDSFYSLYISQATRHESGNYTCYVEGRKIQEVLVIVRVRSVSKAFLRHIQYLGFIFIFSVIFYTAGLIITWTRRDTFKKIDFNTIKTEYSRWDEEGATSLF